MSKIDMSPITFPTSAFGTLFDNSDLEITCVVSVINPTAGAVRHKIGNILGTFHVTLSPF